MFTYTRNGILKAVWSLSGKFFIASLIINILTWFVLWKIAVTGVSDSVLHYNVAYGIDLVDSASKIFLLPATGLAVWLANLILAISSSKFELLRMLSAVMSFMVSLLLLFASGLLIRFVL